MDINLLCAMGPPGGGRNPITQRFTRHFNLLSFCEMEDMSKQRIFSTILQSWLGKGNLLTLLKSVIHIKVTLETVVFEICGKFQEVFVLELI